MVMNNITVLLVEDIPNVRLAIRCMLEEMGLTNIIEAGDGQEALSYVQRDERQCNVILCDWNLPNMSGIELLKEVRKVDPGLPFIMLTARADTPSVLQARGLKVSAYISKPFTLEDLQGKLEAIFGRV